MSYSLKIIFTLLFVVALLLSGCEEESVSTTPPDDSEEPEEQVRETVEIENAQWPLSRSQQPNNDLSYAQFGPRSLPSGYDFHAGIDLPGDRGTSVYPVLPGEVVETDHWSGSGTGAGNAVTVKHSDSLATSYLHLNSISVSVGDWVNSDDVVGTVGSTGASYPHLHLGFFVELPNPNSRDERYSKNPLEILPHDEPGDIPVTFSDNGPVTLDLPLQSMTINSIELIGERESRKADYYDIVARGWTDRKEQVQDGIHFSAERRTEDHLRFNLHVNSAGSDFLPERIILRDFDGEVILDASRD
ncbi:MAG: M23 family metallopeptidase [Balneolaceae bacterium]|nr:M23 family metallopeptidase [Balneolaceae bacterium]MCH8549250.1 M23 family metallopeptidase [Balneolaceae bacterium]